ncbi:MAG: FAD-dependent monooxygenase [Aureispira sp.]|nr:FAD-dependent monooxygenase [Aureispira sp.]
MDKPIIIVGAGLAGALMATYFAKRGLRVDIYESRADMRKEEMSAGRSINLALSDRGLKALGEVGIDGEILREAVPMKGRMLHSKNGELKMAPYGKDDSEYINSISRGGLNMILMTIAQHSEKVNIYFNEECIDVDFEEGAVTVKNSTTGLTKTVYGSTIIGADGANSMVRRTMQSKMEGYKANVDWLEHGYKELSIPPAEGGGFRIAKNVLHIWPRGTYMLIALPNFDGSFTCTLFFPLEGEISFEGLDTKEKVRSFFEEQFADAVPHLVNLEDEFLNNPVGKLGTLKCFPWVHSSKAALIGDAAHAVVPFYGQGMNASFEDCSVLDQCIAKHGTDWAAVYAEYEQLRKENGDAIGDLAVENFYEMRDHVADPIFRRKRELEHKLENAYEDYHSKYSLVTFHPEIPYSVAKEKGNKQDKYLMDLCEKLEDVSGVDIAELYEQLQNI